MKIGNATIDGNVQAVIRTTNGVMPISNLDCFSDSNIIFKTDDVICNAEIFESIKKSIDKIGKFENPRSPDLIWSPVVMRPQKIVCVGLNYKSHVSETKNTIPETPILFGKFINSLAGSGERIDIPEDTAQLDYEGELGIVIGKKGRNINESRSMDYIFGYFVGNDISARDLQFRTSQWLLGKSCDGFYPCGPFITTSDEIKDPHNLSLITKLNGKIMQNSNTSNMIFSIEQLVSYISKFMTLYPGDIISTGTPEGVIQGMPEDSRIWLKRGDSVTVEIEGLGILENVFQ